MFDYVPKFMFPGKVGFITVAMALMSLNANANNYETAGSIGLNNGYFKSANSSPVNLINTLSRSHFNIASGLYFSASATLSDLNNFNDVFNQVDEALEAGKNTALEEINEQMNLLGKASPLRFKTELGVPYMPISFRKGHHYFGLFFDASAGARAKFLNAPVEVVDGELTSKSALHLSTYTHSRFGLDYAAPMLFGKRFTLFGGARVTFNRIGLFGDTVAIEREAGTEINDLILDDYSEHVNPTTDLGLDLSLRFESYERAVEIGVRNLVESSYDLQVGSAACADESSFDCASYNYFVGSGVLKEHESISLLRQAYIQTTHNIRPYNIFVSGYFDFNKAYDLYQSWKQLARLELNYQPSGAVLDSVFIAVERNLVGDKRRKYVAGLSLFNRIKLTGFGSTERVDLNGTDMPMDFGFSLELNTSF